MITSPHNERLKEIRKLNARRREREHAGRFVAEGEDLLAAADAHGWTPLERFAAAGSGRPGIEVDAAVLASAAELAAGTRTLAVYEERWTPSPEGPLCVYLHGVRDPGNVGTVLRAAEAFGASCAVLGPDCADPYGPKAVRASMGAIFAVPLVHAPPEQLPGIKIALDAHAERSLAAVWNQYAPTSATRFPPTFSLLIGAERAGLPNEILQAADETACIPIATESLNAAMAATIALYELTRMAPAR